MAKKGFGRIDESQGRTCAEDGGGERSKQRLATGGHYDLLPPDDYDDLIILYGRCVYGRPVYV